MAFCSELAGFLAVMITKTQSKRGEAVKMYALKKREETEMTVLFLKTGVRGFRRSKAAFVPLD